MAIVKRLSLLSRVLTMHMDRPAEEAASEANATSLDDVFGAEARHPSDMARLQTEHATAGYREAIAAAKQSTIQAGFDDGFRLGAALGLRAGRILGVLQGICEAVGTETDAAAEAERLLATAREELSTSAIFSSSYWTPDGESKFHMGEGEEDVANGHPLIKKWNSLVDQQLTQWAIDEAVLDAETGRLPSDELLLSSSAPYGARPPLDW
ncbi:hypothetical protein XA68_17734 [Ophiocordyceps unilateralis]|uniref:Protein YAE1 n=1 Tax=Ophiocordyceps unilateralis TaxID=268505 RepID=A0A2A9P2K5_OPHUN|nr:hypothetical protein XA68_17734 [Ophiocordyceps unilateralis]